MNGCDAHDLTNYHRVDGISTYIDEESENVHKPVKIKTRSISVPDYTTTNMSEDTCDVRSLNEVKKRRFSTQTSPPKFNAHNSQCLQQTKNLSDLNLRTNQMRVHTNNNEQTHFENQNGNVLHQTTRSDYNSHANNNEIHNNLKRRHTITNSITNSLQQEVNSITTQNCIEITPTSGSFNFPNNIRENSFEGTESNFYCDASSPEEKRKMFRDCITKILSCVYALFIVTTGLVIYLTDCIYHYSSVAEIYNLYLVVGASVYLIYVMIDIRLYVHKEKRYLSFLEKHQNIQEEIQNYGHLNGHFSISMASIINLHKPPHYYCLNKGRHSCNFYLKIGAAVFCLGHLIHSGLLLGYQLVHLGSDVDKFLKCTNVTSLILDVLSPLYSFFILYFIFKYSNLIINRNVSLSRFGLMHTIGASLCFWMWTIIRETVDSLTFYVVDIDDNSSESTSDEDYNKKVQFILSSHNVSAKILKVNNCNINKGLRLIYENYSPYLYPFTVEYNILLVGVLYVIWQNIGKCKGNTKDSSCNSCSKKTDNTSNVVLHADFHSANKGLFCGIILVVISIVSIILFLIIISDEEYLEQGVMVNVVTEIIFLISMATACIFGYRQITKLDVNKHSISLLDDLLLFVCIPAFFVDTLFGIVPAVQWCNGFSISFTLLQLMQVLIQTPFIIDGLRRCSNSKKLREEKPGRELVTFLIVCNVALWITQTFEIKSHGLKDFRYDFYGKLLWTIVGHTTMPLMMFYRFHSSVCLVDIWKLAYEPVSIH